MGRGYSRPFHLEHPMKIKLNCVYGQHGPGDEIETDATEGKRLVDVGAGVEIAEPAPAEKPVKTSKPDKA
jgi:hypothetical protein